MMLEKKGSPFMMKYFSAWIIFIFANSMILPNVTISIGDIEVGGYTEDIIVPITLVNPDNPVGGFQFDIIPEPNIITLSGATPINPDNYSADYNVFDDGSARVIFYDNTGNAISAGGDDIVLNLHYDGSDILSALIDLEAYDLSVSDDNGNLIDGELINGSITIGDVIILSASTDTGDVSELVYLDIELQNSGEVGGLQFDIFDTPNYLDVTGFTTTERTEGFNIDFNELENGHTRIIIYSAENQNISIGSGAIVNMEMEVHEDAYNSNVGVNFSNITVTDGIGGSYWVAGADSGTVTVSPGYIEEPHNLQAQDGLDGQVILSWDPPYGPIPEDFSEDFEEGNIPENWTISTNSSQGWFITQDGSSSFWTIPSHTWYMCSNDDMADDDGSMDYLITPPLNVTGAENITLNFASYYDGAYGHSAHIAVSTDGINFTEVYTLDPASEWVTETVDLSDNTGVPNLYIAFHSNDNGFWASGWAVDDVFITFATRDVPRNLHYRLTSTGEWMLSSPKEDVISAFPGGIPFEIKYDINNPIRNDFRPVELDAFKIYRSLNSASDFEEIAEVGGDINTYIDEDVENSTTYYYFVTAIYPDGSESGPTDVVSATPVEWVELWFDDGSSLSGQMDTLDFYINNESELGLFYFEIMDYPDVLNSINILPTERTSDWALEIADQGDGSIAITGISVGSPLGSGDGPVCRAVLYPTAEEETTVNLSYTTGTSIQDVGYVDLNWTSENGVYEVGIETQYLNLYGGYGNSGEETTGSVFLDNTQPIYAIQFDILADPPFITGADFAFNELLNLDGWSLSGTDIGTGYRVAAYDNSQSNPIEPGIKHLIDINYDILSGVPDGTIIDITISEPVLADVNNLPMVTVGSPHSFYVGQPPVGCTIENANGQMISGGIGTFEIHVDNTETLNILEFEIVDMPDYMVITNITPIGRFDDGTVDGISGETESGSFYFLGYDFATGIEPDTGPILEVEVEFTDNLSNPSVVFMITEISAGDVNANPLTVIADNFGQFNNEMVNIDFNLMIPDDFKLYPNFPNPFNPSTSISFDVPINSNVRLDIYDMRGRIVRNLINDEYNPGNYSIRWRGSDNYGNDVSAGIYIYKLNANGNIFSQKMIFIK